MTALTEISSVANLVLDAKGDDALVVLLVRITQELLDAGRKFVPGNISPHVALHLRIHDVMFKLLFCATLVLKQDYILIEDS